MSHSLAIVIVTPHSLKINILQTAYSVWRGHLFPVHIFKVEFANLKMAVI